MAVSLTPSPSAPVSWKIMDATVAYPDAVAAMEAHVAAMAAGEKGECVWLLEHPACFTAGTSAKPEDLVSPDLLPVFKTGRGGQYKYHGPGQRVAYAMLDLRHRGRDVRAYVHSLEAVLIETLAAFGIDGERREGRVGVWVRRPHGGEDKIAAIGVRVKRWIAYHGISLNVEPDLSHFAGIVPCGVREHGVTSLAAMGRIVSMAEVDQALRRSFESKFGATELVHPLVAADA
ncbi:MAG: lipoyl(octanoyl) transferase LipB [Pseudomonadota bacterium]